MKILYLCTFYHRALLFRQQMDYLNACGHQVRAFSSAQFGEGIAEKFRPIMDEKVIHAECWNKMDRILFFPRQWKIENKLHDSYDLNQFDLLHSQLLLSSGYSALRMKKKYGLPYVVSVRITDLTGFIRIPYFKKMALDIVKNANGVLFLSVTHKNQFLTQYVRKELRADIEEKIAVIGNSLEPFWVENMAPNPRKLKDEKNLRLLLVGKINPVKNIPAAASAVDILNSHGYQATLTVIGEIQDQAEYEKIVDKEHVSVLSFMTKEELLEQYGDHDIFLLPSKRETFGRTYLEAMTQGLPVIYTKGQGFDGLFPDGQVGFAAPCDDPEAIADKIQAVAKDYENLSAHCIESAKNYRPAVIFDQLEQFYQKSIRRSMGL